MNLANAANKPQKELDQQLDHLEASIGRLRILYEQYFTGILPRPPEKEHAEVVKLIKFMLKAPFKNSQRAFRMRTLINRFQTYCTYWERVNKQREDGTYFRDVFKAEMREKIAKEMEDLATKVGASHKGIEQLYQTYESAIRKIGGDSQRINFDSFRATMLKTATELKKKHGATKVSYKVAVRDGKVILKAVAKDK